MTDKSPLYSGLLTRRGTDCVFWNERVIPNRLYLHEGWSHGERYVGWGCILNCFMLSSLPCFYAFCWSAIPTSCYIFILVSNIVIRWFQQDSSQILARPLFLQVVLCKFHSVFLTEEGVVLTCGHGRGGRLAMAMNRELLSVSFHSLTPLSGMMFAYDFQTRYKIIVC